jgi:hypothetical protein
MRSRVFTQPGSKPEVAIGSGDVRLTPNIGYRGHWVTLSVGFRSTSLVSAHSRASFIHPCHELRYDLAIILSANER